MARAATTTDAFNAVAEPRRREILDALAGGERAVGDLVAELGLAQPLVSKHLRVLREVGLVHVRDDGRRRLYRLDGRALKPIHDWVARYERLWNERLDRLDEVLADPDPHHPHVRAARAGVARTPSPRPHVDSGMEAGLQEALDGLERVAAEAARS